MFRIEIRGGRWPGLCIVMAATARCCSNTFIASHFRLARKATQGARQQIDDQQSDEERGFHTSKSTNAQLSEQPESGRSQAFDRLGERRLTRQPHALARRTSTLARQPLKRSPELKRLQGLTQTLRD